MPNKDRERAYLKRFLAAVPACPNSPVRDCEAPDFVVGKSPRDIGLEFTVFEAGRAPGVPHPTEQDRLRWRAIGIAKKLHTEAGGPPLYVRVRFRDGAPLNKHLVNDVAERLHMAIAAVQLPNAFADGDVEIAGASLPVHVVHVRIRASLDGRDSLWNPTFGAWVREVTRDEVNAIVQRKAPKHPSYLNKVSRVWLVIVNDVFSSGDAVELSEAATQAKYDYPFDRVYWLGESGDRAWLLTKRGT